MHLKSKCVSVSKCENNKKKANFVAKYSISLDFQSSSIVKKSNENKLVHAVTFNICKKIVNRLT